MNITPYLHAATLCFVLSVLGACSVDKLEARLQADPQCKSVMNAKTGALMPCPGTDKEFYKSVMVSNSEAPKLNPPAVTQSSVAGPSSSSRAPSAPVECKPQLHQKSGSLMPCPAP
ncbi:MAG: hypothetical protein V4536_09980 [Pseudomonadota bacterium]